jgi:cytochrome c oxidase subunit 2
MNEFLRRMLYLPDQASTVAPSVDHLHYAVILTTLVMSTAVGLTALGFFVRYRRRSDIELTPNVQPGWRFEVLSIGTPLVFFLVWFVVGFRGYVRLATPPPDCMDIYVMAKQWMWQFAYPDGPNSIGVLRVPAGRPIKLLMTSRDVIHSFYVPAFRIKQDVIPGRYTQTWFEARQPGRYQLFCAEFCGTDHSNMLGEVVAMRPEDFEAWLADERRGLPSRQDMAPSAFESTPALGSMAEQGRRLATDYGCLKCHSVDGSPHIGPTWLDLYHRRERLEGGASIDVDEAYLTESMMDPRARIVAGYAPVMPTFQGRLSGPETAAIVEFIKSLRRASAPTAGPAGGPAYEPVRRP